MVTTRVRVHSVGSEVVGLTLTDWPGAVLTVRLRLLEGRPEVASLSIDAPAGTLTTARLASIPTRALASVAAQALGLRPADSGEPVDLLDVQPERPPTRPYRRRSGEPSTASLEFSRAVAEVVALARAQGRPTQQAVRESFGNVSTPTAERWIAEARADGFLDTEPPAPAPAPPQQRRAPIIPGTRRVRIDRKDSK